MTDYIAQILARNPDLNGYNIRVNDITDYWVDKDKVHTKVNYEIFNQKGYHVGVRTQSFTSMPKAWETAPSLLQDILDHESREALLAVKLEPYPFARWKQNVEEAFAAVISFIKRFSIAK